MRVGGMGAAQKNFHLNLIARLGFEKEGAVVQRLFLEGKRAEAAAAVETASDLGFSAARHDALIAFAERRRADALENLALVVVRSSQDAHVDETFLSLSLRMDCGSAKCHGHRAAAAS